MVTEVIENLESIKEACRQMQVKSLYVFGSAARKQDFTKQSDIDFLYSMCTNEDGVNSSGYDYFDVLWRLEEITGRKVDLVPENGIRNKYFLQSINADRIKVYEA